MVQTGVFYGERLYQNVGTRWLLAKITRLIPRHRRIHKLQTKIASPQKILMREPWTKAISYESKYCDYWSTLISKKKS
jgi:hypothetical protein